MEGMRAAAASAMGHSELWNTVSSEQAAGRWQGSTAQHGTVQDSTAHLDAVGAGGHRCFEARCPTGLHQGTRTLMPNAST
jgi:hypothetical protein